MKKITSLFSLLTCAVFAPHVCGQGTIGFANLVHDPRGDVDAPFFDQQGFLLEGPGYVAQLYVWKTGEGFIPMGEPTPFLNDGYFNGGLVVVWFLPGSGSVWIQVRAWETASGETFEDAALAGAWTGASEALFLPETGSGGFPPSEPARLVGLEYPGQPVIVRQPRSQTVQSRQATLSVVASSGVGMTYQWYQWLGERPDGLIVGATNATYATPLLLTHTTYWVTVSNSAGTTTSERATVKLLNSGLPWVGLDLAPGGAARVTLVGDYVRNYQIEYQTNLAAPWLPLEKVRLETAVDPFPYFDHGAATVVDEGATNSPVRFYRAVESP